MREICVEKATEKQKTELISLPPYTRMQLESLLLIGVSYEQAMIDLGFRNKESGFRPK